MEGLSWELTRLDIGRWQIIALFHQLLEKWRFMGLFSCLHSRHLWNINCCKCIPPGYECSSF